MAEYLRYLNDKDRRRLAEHAERHRFEADEVILAEGGKRHAIFVLRHGGARVERSHAEYYVEISRFVGELEAGHHDTMEPSWGGGSPLRDARAGDR